MVAESSLSIEYLLYACDDDYKLVRKICSRLNGLRLTFSVNQLNRIAVQKRLSEGQTVKSISEELDMPYFSVWIIRKRMVESGLIYYHGGDDNG